MFDKVSDTRLMNKIRAHGIQGLTGNWIENWLKGRKQHACNTGAASTWIEVIIGVPQRSVLRAILFLIFVNDLDYGVLNRLLKFADDTKLFGKVQSELDSIGLQRIFKDY